MKKLNRYLEFQRMQKLYENSLPKVQHMDLITFAWNYYNDQIKKFEELRNFWTTEELSKFLKPTDQNKSTIYK